MVKSVNANIVKSLKRKTHYFFLLIMTKKEKYIDSFYIFAIMIAKRLIKKKGGK